MDEININETIRIPYDSDEPDNSTICFSSGDVWIIKITEKNGIIFNREYFQDRSPNDFANEFMDILEKLITVKFYRNKHG